MPKTKAFDATAWAKDQRAVKSRRCTSCQEPYRSVIKSVLHEMESGRAMVSMEALGKMLVREFGFPVGVSSLRQHIRRHEADTWEAIRKDV